MQENFERNLRERFASLRAEVNAVAPPFAAPVVHRTPRRVGVVWTAAAALVLAVVGTWYATSRGEPQVPYAIDLATTTWEAPTDFLLETPGMALLDSIPAITVEPAVLVEPTPQTIDTSG